MSRREELESEIAGIDGRLARFRWPEGAASLAPELRAKLAAASARREELMARLDAEPVEPSPKPSEPSEPSEPSASDEEAGQGRNPLAAPSNSGKATPSAREISPARAKPVPGPLSGDRSGLPTQSRRGFASAEAGEGGATDVGKADVAKEGAGQSFDGVAGRVPENHGDGLDPSSAEAESIPSENEMPSGESATAERAALDRVMEDYRGLVDIRVAVHRESMSKGVPCEKAEHWPDHCRLVERIDRTLAELKALPAGPELLASLDFGVMEELKAVELEAAASREESPDGALVGTKAEAFADAVMAVALAAAPVREEAPAAEGDHASAPAPGSLPEVPGHSVPGKSPGTGAGLELQPTPELQAMPKLQAAPVDRAVPVLEKAGGAAGKEVVGPAGSAELEKAGLEKAILEKAGPFPLVEIGQAGSPDGDGPGFDRDAGQTLESHGDGPGSPSAEVDPVPQGDGMPLRASPMAHVEPAFLDVPVSVGLVSSAERCDFLPAPIGLSLVDRPGEPVVGDRLFPSGLRIARPVGFHRLMAFIEPEEVTELRGLVKEIVGQVEGVRFRAGEALPANQEERRRDPLFAELVIESSKGACLMQFFGAGGLDWRYVRASDELVAGEKSVSGFLGDAYLTVGRLSARRRRKSKRHPGSPGASARGWLVATIFYGAGSVDLSELPASANGMFRWGRGRVGPGRHVKGDIDPAEKVLFEVAALLGETSGPERGSEAAFSPVGAP